MEIRESRRKVSIELEVPNIVKTPCERIVETLVSPGHVCNYCHGQGTVLREDAETHEWEHKECPVCKGCCEMDAVIKVEWRPSTLGKLYSVLKEGDSDIEI